MEQRALVASALVLGCVTAAGAGGYLAVTQSASPASQPVPPVADAADRAGGGGEGTVAEIAPQGLDSAIQDAPAAPAAARTSPPPATVSRPDRPASQPSPASSPAPTPASTTPATPARASSEARPAPPVDQDADAGTANDSWPARSQGSTADNASVPSRDSDQGDASTEGSLPSRTPSTETSSSPAPARRLATVTIPADAVIGVQLESGVSSTSARVEDAVRAKVTRDLVAGGDVVIPAGTRLLGNVTLVDEGGRLRERARLGIRFHTLVLANGTEVRLPTETIYREGESPAGKSAAKIGGAAVGGAILGAIMGGGKGAVIGAATGAGSGTGWAMAGDRRPAELRPGQALTVRVSDNVSTEVER